MICSQCGTTVYRSFSYTDENGDWRSMVCEDCSRGHVSQGFSSMEKLRSRSLMPDGKVITGREGMRIRDTRLRAQTNA